ncbi:MAG: hypothetical protein AUK48_06930 [Oscillatoriales cyanobacterium CG2_30_44_21]|nr:MAG: hypothetical protein AUK48_06930 [Oscillatoriales cyanobacterium CG2_30_44_21]
MSVPESTVAISLEHILASLSIKLEPDETVNQVPLTKALEQLLIITQSKSSLEITQFLEQELEGYRGQPPAYRYVNLSYFDAGGQFIDGLKQYSNYPVGTGLRKLELHLKNGLTLLLPQQIFSFLSQVSGREVDSGHISPSEINILIENIRREVIHQVSVIISGF